MRYDPGPRRLRRPRRGGTGAPAEPRVRARPQGPGSGRQPPAACKTAIDATRRRQRRDAGVATQTMPSSNAFSTARVRSRTPSLDKMLET
jgi:hypothetical protein